MEIVLADPKEPDFKMLVGRLYNAGVSLKALQHTFQSDAKTIGRWGRALRSRNAQELVRMLEGRRANRKLTRGWASRRHNCSGSPPVQSECG